MCAKCTSFVIYRIAHSRQSKCTPCLGPARKRVCGAGRIWPRWSHQPRLADWITYISHPSKPKSKPYHSHRVSFITIVQQYRTRTCLKSRCYSWRRLSFVFLAVVCVSLLILLLLQRYSIYGMLKQHKKKTWLPDVRSSRSNRRSIMIEPCAV